LLFARADLIFGHWC